MNRAAIVLVVSAMIPACATAPAGTSSLATAKVSEYEAAIPERRETKLPAAVSDALLPPLRMDMPKRPDVSAEPVFDLVANGAPAGKVFLSIVSGTPYSMVVHPSVIHPVSISLKGVTVREALDAMRDAYGYKFRFEGAWVHVTPADDNALPPTRGEGG
jgi:MSHA biogenesis protein MshL